MRGGRPTHVKLHGAGELAPDASLLPRVCTLQWSPGSLPGYTCNFQFTALWYRASMEPGITPGIHQLVRAGEYVLDTLQWSPGSFPGYTPPMW